METPASCGNWITDGAECVKELLKEQTDKISEECANDLNNKFKSEFGWLLIVIFIIVLYTAITLFIILRRSGKTIDYFGSINNTRR